MKKIKYIHNDLYDLNIWYFKGWTREEIKKHLKGKYDYQGFSEAHSIGGSVIPLDVWIQREGEPTSHQATVYVLYLPNEDDLGIVAHEVFHIASKVLRDKGLYSTDSSEEAFAYLITWIIDKIKK